PLLALLAQRLASPVARLVAAAGIVLAAAVFWPGIVKQSNLDARPVNAIAALGVLAAFSLTLVAAHTLAPPTRFVRQRGDRLRLLVAVASLALAVPWIAADLGFFLNGVPILGSVYETGQLRPQPGTAGLRPAVHHGHHHGMDGALLVLSALLL